MSRYCQSNFIETNHQPQGDKSFGEEQFKLMNSVDTILLGRVTYKMFAGHWPITKGKEKPFADKLNSIPKIVFSKTLEIALCLLKTSSKL